MEYLPHRYPFLLVDRITEQVPGERAVGIKNVTGNEPWVPGHTFKTTGPIMPATQILEAMSQVAGLVLVGVEDTTVITVVFSGCEGFRVKRQVSPGDQMVIKTKDVRHKGPVWKVAVSASVEGKLVMETIILLTVIRPEGANTEPPDSTEQ